MTADAQEPRAPSTTMASRSTMRRDIGSAYIASLSRIASWAIVSGIVFRVLGPGPFALLTLVRATIGLLNYLTLGLGPAMIHLLAQDSEVERPHVQQVYASGLALSFGAFIVGAALLCLYAINFDRLHALPAGIDASLAWRFVLLMGFATLLRLASEASGAVLQARGAIFHDNMILAAGEAVWLGVTMTLPIIRSPGLITVGVGFLLAQLVVLAGRLYGASRLSSLLFPPFNLLSRPVLRMLLSFGLLVALAQLADYLYAPTDYILINRLLDPNLGAVYAPAVQIDSGLLVLVTGLSAVLLPKAAVAHAGGWTRTVRRYYLRGTLASLGLLAGAALLIWLLSSWLLRAWLADPMLQTQAILPLVLTHTVVGGSSAVGRSILLAVGKVRPFTISVLIAGVTNVVCSFIFVRYLHWGLAGIVLGTIVAVVGRCGLWMPWYVLKSTAERDHPVGPISSPRLP